MSLNNYSPTGVCAIKSGAKNPTPYPCAASIAIYAGDILVQAVENAAEVAVPASSITGSSAPIIQAAVSGAFLGTAEGYRSALITSTGTDFDRILANTGRTQLKVNTADSGSTIATSQLTYWGVAVTNSTLAHSDTVQVVATANLAIGVQSLPKAAGDQYVTIDTANIL